MADREQSERGETAILGVFDNQFPTLTNQIVHNLHRLMTVREKGPTRLLIISGVILLLVSIAIRVGFFGMVAMLVLSPPEFITLISAGSGLIVAGGLLSVAQAWSLRRIITVQQALGTELLNKQIDIGKDLIKSNQEQQWGQLILLPTKKHKRLRRWNRRA